MSGPTLHGLPAGNGRRARVLPSGSRPGESRPATTSSTRSRGNPMTILTAESAPRSLTSQREIGKAIRGRTARGSHADWSPPPDRPDPVDLLESQSAARLPHLLPIRYGRMISSPFAFLRGAAIVMAGDLASTPSTGIDVQACGDCHLTNFGVFATPERNVIFDINDFDETLPAPWEWDVKRLAASFTVACRYRGFKAREARKAVLNAVEMYRTRSRASPRCTRSTCGTRGSTSRRCSTGSPPSSARVRRRASPRRGRRITCRRSRS